MSRDPGLDHTRGVDGFRLLVAGWSMLKPAVYEPRHNDRTDDRGKHQRHKLLVAHRIEDFRVVHNGRTVAQSPADELAQQGRRPGSRR
jgi:hypothetical protein